MTRREQKMAKALHQLSALDVTIGQLIDMLESEGEEVDDKLRSARCNLDNVERELFRVIKEAGLHQALYH